MTIKLDKNLAIVAARANRLTAEVADAIVNGLINAGLLTDEPENYGSTVKECVDPEMTLPAVIDLIKATGVERVNDTTYDAFMNCIIVGDGKCPKCGGELEICDSITHKCPNIDPYTEPDYVTEWEQWRCPVCGYVEEIDNNPIYED